MWDNFGGISEKWKSMTDKEKEKYENLAKKDVERQQNQLAELKKNGFFMTKDGIKSSDLPPPKPKKIKRKANKSSVAEDKTEGEEE